MRILVHEFVTGGGLVGQLLPPRLAREGAAMRDALLADLDRIPSHRITATVDPRVPLPAALGAEAVSLPAGALKAGPPSTWHELIQQTDAVWLVAPETGGCLVRLAAQVEAAGRPLLGSSAAAIRQASGKGELMRTLAAAGIAVPATRVLSAGEEQGRAADEIGFPLVAKPVSGTGCEGVGLARNRAELPAAVDAARGAGGGEAILLQRFVAGTHASVALVGDGRGAVPLAVSAQHIRPGARFRYKGGSTPLNHPLAARAAAQACAVCRAVPGLRGYFGVDVVLTDDEAVVIEINPRLTTAYLGVRVTLDANPAALALEACGGRLPPHVAAAERCVRFSAAGVVRVLERYG